MSHLSCIGYPVTTSDDIKNLVNKLYKQGERIKVENMYYICITEESGAVIYIEESESKELLGLSPHYLGKGRMKVALAKRVNGKESKMEGGFYGWSNPIGNNTNSGLYPIVFDVPNFRSLDNLPLPIIKSFQICAFAENLTYYENEKDFEVSQKGEIKVAPESFLPTGLYNTEEETQEILEPYAIITGKILEFKEKLNSITKEKYTWFLVKTLGGEIDIVSEIVIDSHTIKVGGIVSGKFWLSAKLID